MLFDVTRGALVDIFGENRLVTLPAAAFPASAAKTEGARLLQTVGMPAGTFYLRNPDEVTGLLPLVDDVLEVQDFEDVSSDAGGWPVIGWLLNAHIAFDPGSGKVHAFDIDEETARGLHTDVSSLIHVTLRFQRLLDEFTVGDDEEAAFEHLDHAVQSARRETASIDPLPFQDDETIWSLVGDEIATGLRF
ncbi:SUKH-4 family immunity protein [Streptomyces sp. NPDC055189]